MRLNPSPALRRLGTASPLVPAVSFVVVAVVAEVVTTIWRDRPVVVEVGGYAVPLMLGTWIADVVTQAVVQRSAAVIVLSAPGAVLAFVIRSITGVPISGGVITLARRLTRRRRPQQPSASKRPPSA